jgi:hypothetical protein
MYKHEYFAMIFRANFSKIKNYDLKNSKQSNFWYPIRFSYEEFNKHDKSKIKYKLMYFFS